MEPVDPTPSPAPARSGSTWAEDQPLRRRVLTILGLLLAVAALLWFAFRIMDLLFMVFVSVFVAIAFEPPVHTLVKRGWSRGAATGVVFVAAFVVGVVFLVSLVPVIVSQIGDLIEAIPRYVADTTALVEEWFGLDFTQSEVSDQADTVQTWLTENIGSVFGGVVGVGSTIFGFIFFTITVGIFSFYMVAELPKLQRTVLQMMPQSRQRRALAIWDTAVEKMGGYIYSRLILAAIAGTISALFLTFLKVPFSVPLGIWIGILSQFIPVVGTYIAAILPAIVALPVSPITSLWVIVFFVIYQQIENFLISPAITERTMSLHPAVSIAAIIIGGSILGPIGIILALPFAAIIQALVSTSIRRHEVVGSAQPEVASD